MVGFAAVPPPEITSVPLAATVTPCAVWPESTSRMPPLETVAPPPLEIVAPLTVP